MEMKTSLPNAIEPKRLKMRISQSCRTTNLSQRQEESDEAGRFDYLRFELTAAVTLFDDQLPTAHARSA